jgi:uncharacterized protein YjiS (DUF1127 family)
MAEISARRGEALRIEGASAVFILVPVRSGWEIRRVTPGVFARLAAWWRARRHHASLEALDARTLRDIGLGELAARVEAKRHLEERLREVAITARAI